MKYFRRTEIITLLIVFLLTIPILVLVFVHGDEYWIGPVIEKIIPYGYLLPNTVTFQPGIPFWLTLGVTLMIFLPLSFIRNTKYSGAVCMMVSSYIFAAFLWIYALSIVFRSGVGVLVLGLCFGYIGIIPIALFEALKLVLFYGIFEPLITMLVLAGGFFGARIIKRYALR